MQINNFSKVAFGHELTRKRSSAQQQVELPVLPETKRGCVVVEGGRKHVVLAGQQFEPSRVAKRPALRGGSALSQPSDKLNNAQMQQRMISGYKAIKQPAAYVEPAGIREEIAALNWPTPGGQNFSTAIWDQPVVVKGDEDGGRFLRKIGGGI